MCHFLHSVEILTAPCWKIFLYGVFINDHTKQTEKSSIVD